MREENDSIEGVIDLLDKVNQIDRYNTDRSKAAQENWNIFLILRQAHDEENLHSAFISELLDPDGPHELGAVFAHSFFDIINSKAKITFAIDRSTLVHKERYLGQGVGRADIYLETAGQIAIIENKIWAKDQPRQLSRYYEYLQDKSSGPGILVYLTLTGKDATEEEIAPTDSSTTTSYFPYIRLSYEKDILGWLDRCVDYSASHPSLQSTIRQYIYLVKKLTNQLNSDKMNKELKQAIRENLVAAELVGAQVRNVKQDWVDAFLKKFVKELKDQLLEGWDFSKSSSLADLTSQSVSHAKIRISHADWPETISVVVEGQSNMVDGRTVFGVYGTEDRVTGVTPAWLAGMEAYSLSLSPKNKYWHSYMDLFSFAEPGKIADLISSNAATSNLLKYSVDRVARLCRECNQSISTHEL